MRVSALSPRWSFDLARHDVRNVLPAAIQAIMQNGLLDRTFEDALLPEFLFPALADNEPWQANLGSTQIMTRTGLLSPQTTPVTGSDASTGTYAIEQWVVTMDQYGFSVDTNMLTSSMTLASKFLRDIQTLAINAGQSLNRIARNKIINAYAGGRTYVTTAQGTASTTCVVNNAAGFSTTLVNGVQTAVSAANPLNITIAGTANTVIGVNTATNTLTLGTAVTQTVGQAVVSSVAPVQLFATQSGAARNSIYDAATGDLATFALFRSAVTRLRNMNVPPASGGSYIAHVRPDTVAQLFADPEFQSAYRGRGDSPVYRDLSLGVFGGIDWIENTELNVLTGGTSSNVNIAQDIVVGDGMLIGAPFENMGGLLSGTGVEGVPNIRMIGPATGVQVALIIRPAQDRFQQNLSSTWSWVGDFGVPSDATTGDGAVFKRAVVVNHTLS